MEVGETQVGEKDAGEDENGIKVKAMEMVSQVAGELRKGNRGKG